MNCNFELRLLLSVELCFHVVYNWFLTIFMLLGVFYVVHYGWFSGLCILVFNWF